MAQQETRSRFWDGVGALVMGLSNNLPGEYVVDYEGDMACVDDSSSYRIKLTREQARKLRAMNPADRRAEAARISLDQTLSMVGRRW